MRRERIITIAMVGLTLAGWMPAAGAEDRPVDFPPNPLEKPGWVLTAHDEFDGPELSTELWIPSYLEYRTERDRAAARYELRDDHLVLRIDQDQPTYYHGGRHGRMKISSVQTGQRDRLHKPQLHHSTPTEMKFTQQYGYFEIRARTYRKPGYHSAFWTVGVRDEPWQESEIDIIEQAGHFRAGGDTFNLYSWGDRKLPQTTRVGHNLGFDPMAGFNIYALEWDEKAIRKYVNNELVAEIPHSPSYPMAFFLSIHENAGWTGKADTSPDSRYPKEFVIDYFRAYTRAPLLHPGGQLDQFIEAEELKLEALPVSAGAVELRWNQDVDSIIERKAKGGEFVEVRPRYQRSSGWAGTRGEGPFRAFVDTGLLPDTEYTYRLAFPAGWRYDFGPKSHRPAADHVRVSGSDVFTEAGGFGFEKATSDGTVGNSPRPREYTFTHHSSPFIQRMPNGHYLLGAGGVGVDQFVINGAAMKTEGLGYSNIRAISDVPVEVTDGRLVVDPRGGRGFGWLKIVPADTPVEALATATVRTHSIPHMISVIRDTDKPPADRLAALYALGDMAAAPAASAIAEILLETEQDKGAMHWVAAWAVWRTGLEHVPASRRGAVEKILAGLAGNEPNKGYWPGVGIGVRRPAGGR